MLRKLIKYDLRFIVAKALVIYYIVTLCLALCTRLLFAVDNTAFLKFLAQFFTGATISCMVSILINTVIRCWIRFSQNFYRDESYITHTLPISKTTHYASKILSSLLSMLLSFGVIIIAFIAAYYTPENFEFLKNRLLPLASVLDSSMWLMLLLLVGLIFAQMATMVQAGFTGTLIGFRMENVKVGWSVLFGAIVYFLCQGLVLVGVLITALVTDVGLMELFTTNSFSNFAAFKTAMFGGIVSYIVAFGLLYRLNVMLFKKGVDVE